MEDFRICENPLSLRTLHSELRTKKMNGVNENYV